MRLPSSPAFLPAGQRASQPRRRGLSPLAAARSLAALATPTSRGRSASELLYARPLLFSRTVFLAAKKGRVRDDTSSFRRWRCRSAQFRASPSFSCTVSTFLGGDAAQETGQHERAPASLPRSLSPPVSSLRAPSCTDPTFCGSKEGKEGLQTGRRQARQVPEKEEGGREEGREASSSSSRSSACPTPHGNFPIKSQGFSLRPDTRTCKLNE